MEPDDAIRTVIALLANGQFWMKLLAVIGILGGILQMLSPFGFLWAWLPIWMGVLLFQAADAAVHARANGDLAVATRATNKLRVLFIIQGILLLVALVATVLMIGLAGMALTAMRW